METTKGTPEGDSHKKSIIALVVASVCFAALTFIPAVRTKLQTVFSNPQRNVLAKISGFFSADQTQYLILKVKDLSGLQIEVYEVSTANNTRVFKQKFDLSEDADSYVTLDRNSTNLALQDIDEDGDLDIIAPSVDRNGNLRLNTFRYNGQSKSFEPYVKHE